MSGFKPFDTNSSGSLPTFTPNQSPFTDDAARDVWAAANLDLLYNGDASFSFTLVENGLVAERWSGENKPSSYDSSFWVHVSAGAAAFWGSIGGNIADQLDLAEVAKTNNYNDLDNTPALRPAGSDLFVHKNGSDSNSGLTPELPLQTIGEAITKATAMIPAEGNQITIEVIDTGTYTESPTLPEWVHLDATNAASNGRLTFGDNSIISFRRMQNPNTTQPVARKANGLGFAKLAVELLVVAGSAQEGLLVDAGVAHIDAGVISIDAGIGIKAKNGSRVSFIISEVQLLNGGLGIGTRTAGGDPNFFSGNILYAKDDGTGVFVEAKVLGDIINIQGGSVIVDTLYDMGANTTLNIFVTEASGSINSDPTATINSTLAGVSNFNPTTGIAIERIIESESVAATQNPVGLGPSNAVQIEFGPAQNSGSDPVQISAAGAVTINEAGLYRIKVTAQIGRSGSAQVSEIVLRALFDGVQAGASAVYRIDDADSIYPFRDEQWLQLPAGLVITYEIMRDSTQNNSGGLIGQSINVEAGSWNQDPSASIRIERLISPP